MHKKFNFCDKSNFSGKNSIFPFSTKKSSRRIKWHQNDWIWTMLCVIETKTLISCFRFNNPKHCLNSIILVSFYSSRRDIKNAVLFFPQFFKDWQNMKTSNTTTQGCRWKPIKWNHSSNKLLLNPFHKQSRRWITQLKNFERWIFRISIRSCSSLATNSTTGLLQWNYFMDHKLAITAAISSDERNCHWVCHRRRYFFYVWMMKREGGVGTDPRECFA